MRKGIEDLLHLVADYHNFCNEEPAGKEEHLNSDEMSLDELDLVAAAAGQKDFQQIMDRFMEDC